MKFKYLVYAFIILIISFVFLFPKYYFNKEEQKGQEVFKMIEEGRDKDDFKKVATLILTHKSIVNNQEKISKLLPNKYKEYLKLKKDLYSKYYESLAKFNILKSREAEIRDVEMKREEFIKSLNNTKDKGANAMDVYIVLNAYVNKKEIIKKSLDDGFITKEFYNAILADMDKNIEIYNIMNDTADLKISPTDMNSKIDEINKKYKDNDLAKISNDSYLKINAVKQKEWIDIYKEAEYKKYLVDKYYEQNNLGKVSLIKNYKVIKANYNGDDNNETFVISDTIFAYNDKDENIARLSKIIPLIKTTDNGVKTYNLNNSDKKQVVRLDFPEKENIISTMFFGLLTLKTGGETILPICHVQNVKTAMDCLFISKESDPLLVSDLDNDRIIEIDKTIDSKKYKFNGVYFEELKE